VQAAGFTSKTRFAFSRDDRLLSFEGDLPADCLELDHADVEELFNASLHFRVHKIQACYRGARSRRELAPPPASRPPPLDPPAPGSPPPSPPPSEPAPSTAEARAVDGPPGSPSEEEGVDRLPPLPWLNEECNAALLEKAAAAEAAEAAKANRVREAAAREACQYDDPSNAYSPLGTDADTDFGDTDTEDSNDDATTVLPHLLPPPSYHDPSPCAPR